MSSAWTKTLVQQHAQSAVAVELYTLPFYFTVLTSIKDTSDSSYSAILGVCMEEMLHLQLAANLCLALDTTPNFTAPVYGTPIPFLKPDDPETKHNALVNAIPGALDPATLQMMLDIETPAEFEVPDSTEPQTVYNSIAQMYASLYKGIETVGESQFTWTTTNQQAFWSGQPFVQTIAKLSDAKNAIDTIGEQGEGKAMKPVPVPPFTESEFPIPKAYQLLSEAFDTDNQYSHYGRFVKIKNLPTLPTVYGLKPSSSAQTSAQAQLQSNFAGLISSLNSLWTTGSGNIFTMTSLITDAQACWAAGIAPKWS